MSELFRPGTRDADLRVSDAERSEVADRLADNYAQGRLDRDEFNERLEAAMAARTRADLSGLLAGLPGSEPPAAVVPDRRSVVDGRRRPPHRFLVLALVFVVAASIGQAVIWSHIPWLLIGVLAFLWIRRSARNRQRW